jgi:hypothetical protein
VLASPEFPKWEVALDGRDTGESGSRSRADGEGKRERAWLGLCVGRGSAEQGTGPSRLRVNRNACATWPSGLTAERGG